MEGSFGIVINLLHLVVSDHNGGVLVSGSAASNWCAMFRKRSTEHALLQQVAVTGSTLRIPNT